MSPVNLQPFFYQGTEISENDDITMATLVTRNRFKVLSRLASHYQGKKKLKSFPAIFNIFP